MTEIFWHNLTTEETAITLKSDVDFGLAKEEVEIRQREFGKNILPKEKPLSGFQIFLGQFASPLVYVLVIAGLITLFLRDFTDTVVIFGAVFLNAIVGFLQENKASQTMRELKRIVQHTVTVKREGNLKVVDSAELVAGDIIILNPGDKAPADCRILESRNLKINEMALTGEWLLSEKTADVLPEKTVLADRDNMAYMGTIVEEGSGKAIVVETGRETEIGKVADMVKKAKEEKTPYQKKLSRFAKIVGLIVGIISFAIFIEGIATGGEFVEMFTVSAAVAVAAIPEGLPVAMTVVLALGMRRILKRKGLVRKLTAAETLGSASIIATDKTATLTEGRMRAAEITGDKNLVLKAAVLASEAFIENPGEPREKWIVRGRPTDRALLEAGIDFLAVRQKKKIAETPFSPLTKFASVEIEEDGKQNLYILGAAEDILAKCALKEGEAKILENQLEEFAKKGLRVLAAAQNWVFSGFIILEDPIRPEAVAAIKMARQAGMKPIIITGDHKFTAQAVAEQLGLRVGEENILEGKDLDGLSEKEFDRILPKIQIFARTEPRHKMQIVEAWQKRGEVVAMTGDGINDAPALKKADIGIALGSGTEVAKETADLVLLNDSFSIIVAAIEEGRTILDNIRKVITYLFSGSFTEVILIAGSMAVSWFTNQPWILPVLAGQILWVNLIEDGPLGLSLAFEPKEKDLMKHPPQNHNHPLLTREMKALIFIIGLITDFLLLGLLFWLLKFSNYEISHIRSIIFATLAIDSIFYVFSCKSLRKNLWQINPFSNRFLIFAWGSGVAMLLSAFYLAPLQTLLKTVPLNFFDWQIILGLGLINIILIEVTKWFFISKEKNERSV